MKTYRLTTLGCKVNQYETEQIRTLLESLGLREAPPGRPADLAVVNTCAVTGEACKKSRQLIRRAARTAAAVIAVGCYATDQPETVSSLPKVIAAIGHDRNIVDEIRQLLRARMAVAADKAQPDLVQQVSRTNPENVPQPPGLAALKEDLKAGASCTTEHGVLLSSFSGHQRAFVKVQDGCDAFCTYCIIPRLRRQLRSKPPEIVVKEVESLVRAGHTEIVLAGIYLGAYGRGTAIRRNWSDGGKPSPLADLITRLSRIDGLQRLRLSSLEPLDLTEDLLEAMAASQVCVPHLHLPLQSGSDAVLKRMGRQYTVRQYMHAVSLARKYLDRPAITTDVIVGFPGETAEDFEATLAVADEVGFLKIHAFRFSPRPGTAASRWRNMFVQPQVIEERMDQLQELERQLSLRFRLQFVGQGERIIPEPPKNHPADGNSPVTLVGKADRYFPIAITIPAASAQAMVGRMVPVRIKDVTEEITLAEPTCEAAVAEGCPTASAPGDEPLQRTG